MFGWVLYRWQMRRLIRSKAKTARIYARLIRAARDAQKPWSEIQSLYEAERFETDTDEEEIRKLVTRRLLAHASFYFLPTPTSDDDWADCDQTGGRCLTLSSMKELRAAIRKERAERRQDIQGALFWLSGLTGAIGAITGLVAVLKK